MASTKRQDGGVSEQDQGMNIYGDKWSGLHCEEWEVCASPEELVARLVRLDAQVHTLLSLASGPPDEAHLGVGGGAGQYLVYQQVSDLELWNIVRPDAEKAWVSLNTGGQDGDHPARQVVDLATAQAACLWYLEHGTRNPSLCWEKQDR